MYDEWVLKNIPDTNTVKQLSKDLHINEYLATLLVQRGITNYDSAYKFFKPSLDNLYDPFLMYGMTQAVEIIMDSIKSKEKILLYGDYDVDGTTAVAVMYNFLTSTFNVEDNLSYVIPNRFLDGYGINVQNIQRAIDNNIGLIITFDCGVKDYYPIQLAKKYGIKVIVSDHHESDDNVTHPADVVIDPKQNKCNYPFKGLSGCGVCFKLVQAIVQYNKLSQNKPYEYLDLVALSTACDIVPVSDENRILLFHGLQKINFNPQLGLKSMIKIARIRGIITDNILQFVIGPRINAVGRLYDADMVIKLFISQNEQEAKKIAEEINVVNMERKNISSNITSEAMKMIRNIEQKDIIVLYNQNWHQGVLGIVAAKCVENTNKPTVLLTKNVEGDIVGSARSNGGLNIHDVLCQCSNLLKKFGGHECAAGFVIEEDNIDSFKKKIEMVVSQHEYECQCQLICDMRIPLKNITHKFCNVLSRMAPFGEGNVNPVFISTVYCLKYSIFNLSIIELVISPDGHSTIQAKTENSVKKIELLKNNKIITIAYTIDTYDKPTLRIIDIKRR